MASELKTLGESDVAEAGRRIPDYRLTIVQNYIKESNNDYILTSDDISKPSEILTVIK